jgi:hypothetical protein
MLEEVPLLAAHPPGHPQIGLADGGHDVSQVTGKFGVVVLDVAPPLLAQDDTSTIGIRRRREHGSIVALVAKFDNSLLRTCP